MALRKDRIFALLGAVLFVGSTLALSIVVIIQQLTTSSTPPPQNPAQAQQCTDNSTEPTMPAPASYRPPSSVASLQVTDLSPGSGLSVKNGDCVSVKYYGSLASTGALFDENYTKPTAFAFRIGQGQVIKGWDQGLIGLQSGGERRLVIPASLAYGTTGACQAYDPKNTAKCTSYAIPPGADLVFIVKLLRIQ